MQVACRGVAAVSPSTSHVFARSAACNSFRSAPRVTADRKNYPRCSAPVSVHSYACVQIAFAVGRRGRGTGFAPTGPRGHPPRPAPRQSVGSRNRCRLFSHERGSQSYCARDAIRNEARRRSSDSNSLRSDKRKRLAPIAAPRGARAYCLCSDREAQDTLEGDSLCDTRPRCFC